MDGQKEYVQIDQNDLYPYLLVNIGSGVSMIKVGPISYFEAEDYISVKKKVICEIGGKKK